MKLNHWVVVLCVLSMLSASCSFAPLTPRVDAASIGKNQVKLESNVGPTASIGILYGLNENLDIGLEVEQDFLGTTWARYSFINNPSGFSLAGNAGVFISTSRQRQSNGWYAGLLLSNQINSSVRFNAGYRHALLDYQYGLELDNFSRRLEFDNPDDASVNGHLDITFSIKVRPHVELALGAACEILFKNTNPDVEDEICVPVIGFSFYRL